jgi:sn-glycerol 3-phosphate transport system ATP-binding protein
VRGTDGPALVDGRGDGRCAGVRPEDIRIGDGAGLAARVAGVEYLGADSIVTCVAGTETLAVRAPGRVTLGEGTPLRLTWSRDALHFFDVESGQAAKPEDR